ncbi:GYD domain-containing protein [Acidobacteria bacterium AH-259-O06]|nr:GYD domain-containing protein [Acidobacteria bacterium AH-259-O06]
MPTYITLINWTQKGIENVKDSPSRLDQFKQAVSAAGGEVKTFYMTMGSYDLMTVVEVPDDETYARLMLSTASLGNARTQTLRAFTEEEYRNIIAGLS